MVCLVCLVLEGLDAFMPYISGWLKWWKLQVIKQVSIGKDRTATSQTTYEFRIIMNIMMMRRMDKNIQSEKWIDP